MGRPFACRAVRPDIAVVSNHGGRVDTSIGSTAEFLKAAAGELHSCCGKTRCLKTIAAVALYILLYLRSRSFHIFLHG